MAFETSQPKRPAWWVYALVCALSLPGVWLLGTLSNTFEGIGVGALAAWLGALVAGILLAALAFAVASRWPRHGALWGLLLAAPTLFTIGLWLVVHQARVDAALLFESLGNLSLLTVLAIIGGRWGQRRRSKRLTLAKRLSNNALAPMTSVPPTPMPASSPDWLASLLIPVLIGLGCLSLLILTGRVLLAGEDEALTMVFPLVLTGGCLWSAWRTRLAWNQRRALLVKRPEALAIGATIRLWLPSIGLAHGALNLVVLTILGLAVGVSLLFGPLTGELTGFLLSAPQFLVFGFLLQGLSTRLRPAVPRKMKGWDQGAGYGFLLGFAAMWLGILGSMQAVEIGILQRAEVFDGVRLAELPAYDGRNALIGVENLVPARLPVQSHGWRRQGEGSERYDRVYVVPLTERLGAVGADSVTPDKACVWLGIGTADRGHREQVPGLREQPRWLREVTWGPLTTREHKDRYRRAIGGPSDAERGCRPVVFQSVAAPEKLQVAAWRQLALYFGLGNLVPLLMLLGYGLWRLDQLGADEILIATRANRGTTSHQPHPLQRLFQCSNEDREHYRAGRLSQRQHQRIQQQLWLAVGGTIAGMVLAGLWIFLAVIMVGHVWNTPEAGWGARAATAAALLLGLFFLIGMPVEQWRKHRLARQDLGEGRVERLTGQVHRQMIRHHKSANEYWIIMDGQRFSITDNIHALLKEGALYDLYRLPRTRRLLAILPADRPAPRSKLSKSAGHA
ncbi:hypothetical protein Thiowin_01507 [Thiorhodovibrio winogradskyi]|uniref:DUF3592 domain-containing protein n=1 Tax=Thiorhodovibrio winogradskyi TaxID=77007 RepID=A0ABZ0S8F4_9GAMM|nr:hypothetical protein [Thiorhodovibrio winogradskyi]